LRVSGKSRFGAPLVGDHIIQFIINKVATDGKKVVDLANKLNRRSLKVMEEQVKGP
jgi:ribosomal protein S7